MWPFRQKQNEVITISLTPQNIICSLIEAPKKNEITYKLNAYKRIPLKQFEFSQAIVFNTKIIKHHITSFLKTVAKKKCPVALSISGPKIFEKIITVKTTTPTLDDFNISNLQKLNVNSLYLCPSQKNGFDFFVCGIKPEHLFSYQLLANSCGINVQTITTQQHTYLSVYRHLHGKNFRQSKLSEDLFTNRYDIHALISADIIEKSFTTNDQLGINVQKEYPFLCTSLGLFLEGHNENY